MNVETFEISLHLAKFQYLKFLWMWKISDFSTSVMYRNFSTWHIFSTYPICDICEKYVVCLTLFTSQLGIRFWSVLKSVLILWKLSLYCRREAWIWNLSCGQLRPMAPQGGSQNFGFLIWNLSCGRLRIWKFEDLKLVMRPIEANGPSGRICF